MSELEHILGHINAGRVHDLLVEVVNIYSPSYAEVPVLRAFMTALERSGVPYRTQLVPAVEGDQERANILIELGPTPPEVMFVGHVDTIPFWGDEVEDHGALVEDDVMWGLGSADMKSGCVAMVEAVSALLRAGVRFERGLCVALVVGEEDYGDGSEALLEAVTAPLTIIGEPTNLVPCTEHYGYFESRLSATGTRAHAALPDIGANAIHAMLTWLIKILEQGQALPVANEIHLNPRSITGGGELFIIAESCEAMLDMHLGPSVDPDQITELIERARAATLANHQSCTLTHEPVYYAPAYAVRRDDPRLAPVERAFAACGFDWKPVAFRSHSDGNMFFQRGVAPVVCGPGDLTVAHTREEHVHLSQVVDAARLYASIMYEVCVRE